MGYLRNQNIVSADMAGDTVMMSIEQGAYFGINDVGRAAWDILESRHDEDQIIQKLLAVYDIDEVTCQREVRDFLRQLLENKLIVSV